MTLLDLAEQPEPIPVRDSHVTEPGEQQRLSGQNLRIYQALQRGSMSNRELAAISLKYTSRLSDVRKFVRRQGLDVSCIERNYTTGFSRYALVAKVGESA